MITLTFTGATPADITTQIAAMIPGAASPTDCGELNRLREEVKAAHRLRDQADANLEVMRRRVATLQAVLDAVPSAYQVIPMEAREASGTKGATA